MQRQLGKVKLDGSSQASTLLFLGSSPDLQVHKGEELELSSVTMLSSLREDL